MKEIIFYFFGFASMILFLIFFYIDTKVETK